MLLLTELEAEPYLLTIYTSRTDASAPDPNRSPGPPLALDCQLRDVRGSIFQNPIEPNPPDY